MAVMRSQKLQVLLIVFVDVVRNVHLIVWQVLGTQLSLLLSLELMPRCGCGGDGPGGHFKAVTKRWCCCVSVRVGSIQPRCFTANVAASRNLMDSESKPSAQDSFYRSAPCYQGSCSLQACTTAETSACKRTAVIHLQICQAVPALAEQLRVPGVTLAISAGSVPASSTAR